jgi:hypothetical protein
LLTIYVEAKMFEAIEGFEEGVGIEEGITHVGGGERIRV